MTYYATAMSYPRHTATAEDCTLQHFKVCSKGDGIALAPVAVPSKCLGTYVPDRVVHTAFQQELTSLMTCKAMPTPTAMSLLLSTEQLASDLTMQAGWCLAQTKQDRL